MVARRPRLLAGEISVTTRKIFEPHRSFTVIELFTIYSDAGDKEPFSNPSYTAANEELS